MNYLSVKDLKQILITSNLKDSMKNKDDIIETNACKKEINNLKLTHKVHLDNIIEEKKKKSTFLKTFLRKVF